MDAIQVFGFLIGASAGLFLLIVALVTLPARVRAGAVRSPSAGAVWFGGPHRSERCASGGGLVLVDRPVHPLTPEVDWAALAEISEPGRHLGGGAARW